MSELGCDKVLGLGLRDIQLVVYAFGGLDPSGNLNLAAGNIETLYFCVYVMILQLVFSF